MVPNHRSGFSLIVLSLILAAASLLLILAMPSDSDKLADKVKRTSTKLQIITNALSVYYEANNALPCPAKFTSLQNASDFGVSNCTCGSGIICPSTAGMGNLIIGAIPVKNLGLADTYLFDEWNRRFTYAMDNSVPPKPLIVKDLNGNLDVSSKGSQPIAFFFSHGPNGKGAYLYNGALNSVACTGANSSEDFPRSELENCDSTLAATADRNFIKSSWNAAATTSFDDMSGEVYKKAWVGFKDDGLQWLLFQMEKNGTLTNLASATALGANNIWTLIFGSVQMGPVACKLADNGKTICVVVGDKYINSLQPGCNALAGGCATYWAFTAKPDIGFISNTNTGGFQAGGNFTNFNYTLLGSKPKVKCWKVASTRFLCMAVSNSYYKIFSMDTETGINEISTAAPTIGGAFNGYNFWGSTFTFDIAGFDCAPSGNAAKDFICLAAGQGGAFQSFKLNEATGITNKSGVECYAGASLLNTLVGCSDLVNGGQARDVSCNMITGSTSKAACVAVYNKTLSGRAARLYIATTSAATPTNCPTPSTNTTNTCLVTPAASAGDNLKAQNGTTQFTTTDMGDVMNLNCTPNSNNFSCLIGGTGAGSTAVGYIGLYKSSAAVFNTTALQSSQPGGGVYGAACTILDEGKYYCLNAGTGTGSACVAGTNNCNYSVWNYYQSKLIPGTYTAWPADTSWTYFSIAK